VQNRLQQLHKRLHIHRFYGTVYVSMLTPRSPRFNGQNGTPRFAIFGPNSPRFNESPPLPGMADIRSQCNSVVKGRQTPPESSLREATYLIESTLDPRLHHVEIKWAKELALQKRLRFRHDKLDDLDSDVAFFQFISQNVDGWYLDALNAKLCLLIRAFLEGKYVVSQVDRLSENSQLDDALESKDQSALSLLARSVAENRTFASAYRHNHHEDRQVALRQLHKHQKEFQEEYVQTCERLNGFPKTGG